MENNPYTPSSVLVIKRAMVCCCHQKGDSRSSLTQFL